MIRFLQLVNFLGVVALVTLAAFQWRANRAAQLLASSLEQARIDQVQQIAERDRTIAGQKADLAELKSRLTTAEEQLKDLADRLLKTQRERDALVIQRDQLLQERKQLREAIEKWTAAVKERDAALQQAAEQMRQVSQQRDAAIAKFNDLAERWNKMVGGRNNPATTAATRPSH